MSEDMTRQLVSSTGLALLFTALGLSIVHSLLAPVGLVVASAPLMFVGVGIAVYRRWQVLASAATVGSLFALGVGSVMGTTVHSMIGVIVIAAVSGALSIGLRWSWLMMLALGSGGGLLLAVHNGCSLSPWWIVSALGGLWFLASIASSVHATMGQLVHAERLAVTSAAVALVVGAVVMGLEGIVMVVIGSLIASQGLLMERLARESSFITRLIVIAGVTVAALSAHLWLGGPGTALALCSLAVLLWASGHTLGKRSLAIAGLVALAGQTFVMAATHPGWAHQATSAWIIWAGVGLTGAVALHWMRWRSKTTHELELPTWTIESLVAAEVLYVLCSGSTLLAIVASGGPALNLFWLTAGALCWIFGRRREMVGLQVAAVVAVGAAVIKLLAFDWFHFTGPVRVLLVFLTGVTLLVAPLGASRKPLEHSPEGTANELPLRRTPLAVLFFKTKYK